MEREVALVLKHNDKILFGRRSKMKDVMPNLWTLPSFPWRPGETSEQAALRAANELFGVKVSVNKVLHNHQFIENKIDKVFVACDLSQGQIDIKKPEELIEIKWDSFPVFFQTNDDSKLAEDLRYLKRFHHLWKNV